MIDLPNRLRLVDCQTKKIEIGTIEPLDRETAKRGIDAAWWDDSLDTLSALGDEPDSHWEWRELVSTFQNKPAFRARCVKCSRGRVHGAMLLRVDAKSALDPGEKAVFVDRIATAPWNRDRVARSPLLRGSGTGLLVYATALSYSLGFGGRVSLIPIANQNFYANRGFVPTDTTEKGETLFELPAAVAHRSLAAEGLIDA